METVNAETAVEIESGGSRASVIPAIGSLIASFQVDGQELLALPASVDDYARHGTATAVPLLFPWANRLEALRYAAGGRSVDLSGHRDLMQFNGGLPIHGVLPSFVRMSVVDRSGDELAAVVEPAAGEPVLRVFPFPHRLGVRVAVRPSALTVETTLVATSDQGVPVSLGYHPYLALPGGDRDDWRVSLSAREHLLLDDRLIPTGTTEPADMREVSLLGRSFDDGYGSLGETGTLRLQGGGRTLTVLLEEGYSHAQVYAPEGRRFVALEPMTAPTNALVSGTALRLVQPGEEFVARFTIRLD
jgi:galactose mutarotase-like enzyme